MKNGKDRAMSYNKLNYKEKFKRTLTIIPFNLAVITFMFITDAISLTTSLILTIIIVALNIFQLIYTYWKWKREEVSDGVS